MAKKLTKTQKTRLRQEQQQRAKAERERLESINRGLGLTNQRPDHLPSSPKPYKRETTEYPSLDTQAHDCSYREPLRYTGDRLKGIGMMHKSNLVPIFDQSEAEDIAKMRRN